MGPTTAAADAKAALRVELRRRRRAVADPADRSVRIWAAVASLDAVRRATTVMAFRSLPGEPDTAPLVEHLRARGVTVLVPEDEPDPSAPDVVLVPGLGFTAVGDRLGQGGGWYDRFLAARRPECVAVGVAFAEQLLATLPTEPHDVRMDVVITDRGVEPRAEFFGQDGRASAREEQAAAGEGSASDEPE